MGWKDTERAIAKRTGGVRTGCTGRATSDVVTESLAIECKTRATLPAWLGDAIAQAVRNAHGDRLPAVLLHQTGRRHDNDVVCLRLEDFLDWFGSDLL